MRRTKRSIARSGGTLVAGALLAAAACNKPPGPDAYGNVEATEVVVGSQTTGQVKSFEPVEGQRVDAGEIVAVVDTTALQLQLREATSERSTS
ncbi:MAG TPA: hypothetical protein VGH04_12070, partial [Gemmatimonadaceae bacterium]